MNLASRRALVLGSAVAPLGAVLAACGGQSQPAGQSPSQTLRGTVTYRDWWPTVPSLTGWINFVKEDWAKTYPNVTLNLEPVAGADYLAKFIVDNASGTVPDVMHASVAYVRGLWNDKALEPLNPYVAKTPEVAMDKFIPQALFYNQVDGKIFGMPHEGPAGHAIYFNVDHFKEVGFDPSYEATKNMTWDTLLAAARKLAHPRPW